MKGSLEMASLLWFGLLALFGVAQAKYVYMANMDNDASHNLYKSGADGWDKWMKECDALGDMCAGFDSDGNMKGSMDKLTQNGAYSVWVKADGPSPTSLPKLWPLPKTYSYGSKVAYLTNPTFRANITSTILNKAIDRYQKLIFDVYVDQDSDDDFLKRNEERAISSILINVGSANEDLQLYTDDSYTLVVTSATITITSKTVYGAIYGLETLSQLVHYNYTALQYEIQNSPWVIMDSAQFSYRGLLVDTSRHYLPIVTLERIIDSLSYAKLNVLHWHLVDTQSFPLESKKFPKLWNGAWSSQERYTQAAVKHLVQYGKERGVNVMAEFDSPGHAWAWGVGYPGLHPSNYGQSPTCDSTCPTNPCDVPLDPSNDMTFEVITGLFSEVTGGVKGAGIFPFDLLHLGGDEVEYGCWNESMEIQRFMIKNGLDFEGLYKYHIKKVDNIALSFGRTPVHWEEVFNHFGTQLNPKTIIHIWLDHKTLAKVVAAGYRGILSNQDNWYLDHLDTDWTIFYKNDPYKNINDQKQQDLVIGGEACMWGETVDPTDVFQRVWPRAGAFAERVWNYNQASKDESIELALPRLASFRCHLLRRGIDSAPLFSFVPNQPGGCGSQ